MHLIPAVLSTILHKTSRLHFCYCYENFVYSCFKLSDGTDGARESSRHCCLRKHANRQKHEQMESLHQFDNMDSANTTQ